MRFGLIHTCDVYTRTTTRGQYDTLAREGLPCRFAHVGTGQATTSEERVELAALRHVLWETYEMPDYAQLDFAGKRWQVMAGTLKMRTLMGAEHVRTCDVKEQRV